MCTSLGLQVWKQQLAVLLPWPAARLDTALGDTAGYDTAAAAAITRFHAERGLPLPDVSPGARSTHRMVLAPLVDAYRLLGQPVTLLDAVGVGVELALDIDVAAAYFRSEVLRVVAQSLGNGAGGFFEPGRLRLGEDLHASDLYQLLLGLEGVATSVLRPGGKIRVGEKFIDAVSRGELVESGKRVRIVGFSGRDCVVEPLID